MNAHITLQELLDSTPKAHHAKLRRAYAAGENEAGLKLLSKPSPAMMSPASLPPLQRNLMFHAVLLHVQHLQVEWYLTDTERADRMRLSQMKQATQNNFNFVADLLGKTLRISDTQGQLSNKDAAKVLLESYQTLAWELLESLMATADPVRLVSMVKLLESGVARIEEENEPTEAAA